VYCSQAPAFVGAFCYHLAVDDLRYYFAYGSNLSHRQMLKERCPGAECVAAHQLEGWRLEFVGERTERWGSGGVATVVQSPGGSVPGAIYRITPEHEAILDGYEGVALGIYVKRWDIVAWDGQPALIYVATHKAGWPNAPGSRYLEVIRAGYLDWEMDAAGLPGTDFL
jgi:gamma-glutamylcyclotransferase (GGCT)/AIG2-like uncharacterized protein YtfP